MTTRTRTLDGAERKPLIMWPHVLVLPLREDFGYQVTGDLEADIELRNAMLEAGIKKVEKFRKTAVGRRNIEMTDATVFIGSDMIGNVNVSKQRGAVKSVILVGSKRPFDPREIVKLEKIAGSLSSKVLRGDVVWDHGSTMMSTYTPAAPMLTPQFLKPVEQILFDLSKASGVASETPYMHPLRKASQALKHGVKLHQGETVYMPDRRVKQYMVRGDMGDLFHPRSLVTLGSRGLSGHGVLVPGVTKP